MRREGAVDHTLGRIVRLCRERLFSADSSDSLFNQYLAEDPAFDRAGAAEIRCTNLIRYFESYRSRPRVVVVAEAPGPWGCRFTGVPITSEEQLADPEFPLSGDVSGVADSPRSEYSARIFWRVMRGYFPEFIVWNAVPIHPHRVGEPMSIRAPRISELRSWGWLTKMLVSEIDPEVVVALGRKAEVQLRDLGIGSVYVRHPSQGGALAFEEGMRRVFGSLR